MRLSGMGDDGCILLPLPAAASPLLLLLSFHLFDQLIERRDHAVFDLRTLLPARPNSEPTANVVHPPRNVIQRVVFQSTQIIEHQRSHRLYRTGLSDTSSSNWWMLFKPSFLLNNR